MTAMKDDTHFGVVYISPSPRADDVTSSADIPR